MCFSCFSYLKTWDCFYLIYISKKWYASRLISCTFLIGGLKITEPKKLGLTSIVSESRLAKSLVSSFECCFALHSRWFLGHVLFIVYEINSSSFATAASCIGSLLRSPSLYSKSGGANDSGSGLGGIADVVSGFLVAVPVVMAQLLVLLLLELGGLLLE